MYKGSPGPEARQAKLQVGLTTSPTLSLSDPSAELEVHVNVRILHSKSPGESITFLTDRTVFDVFEKGEGGMDMFSRGAFGRLHGIDGDGKMAGAHIHLGFFRVNEIMKSDALDLRERGCGFLTIPGDGSPVTVTHKLGWDRIFKYEEKLTKKDLNPGDRFQIGASNKFIRTGWWCFGDLEGDLKNKKFHEWHVNECGLTGERPDDDFLRGDDWVLGQDPKLLRWKKLLGSDSAIFKIVE